MSKKTPKNKKVTNKTDGFSPLSLIRSPIAASNQNLTGYPRILSDIIADLYNNIQVWNRHHINGCSIVKQIASLKVNQPNLNSELEQLINELCNTVEFLKNNIKCFNLLIGKVEAFNKLPNVSNPLFSSLSATYMIRYILDIANAYKKEFKMKNNIVENIAFTKTKCDAMYLTLCWTYQLNITDKIKYDLELLLLETGHKPIYIK